jgi:hypothetical protein
MRDFLISVASGFAVAILSAIFLRRSSRGSGSSQSMSMGAAASGGGVTQFLLVFLLGAVVVLAVLTYMKGELPFTISNFPSF